MATIYVKDYDISVNFPDNTPPEEISSVLKRNFPPRQNIETGVIPGARSFTAGINEGLANMLGMPVDIVNAALSKLGVPVSEKPIAGSKFIKEEIFPEAYKPQ